MMTMKESLASVFDSNFFSFKGRASRAEFWWFVLFTNLVVLVAFLISAVLGAIVVFGFMPLYLSVACRRFHDINMSGWWNILLVCFSPFALLFILKGDEGSNRFGDNPLDLRE